jgi:hypothetical protein
LNWHDAAIDGSNARGIAMSDLSLTSAALIGAGATALIDLWAVVRRRVFGIPALNYAYVGRWFAHLLRGRWRHDPIAATQPVRGEAIVGWMVHYLTGIVFAVILLALVGPQWPRRPTLLPALIVGITTVIAPFFIMQPAMGAGIANSRAPRPAAARIQSLITHAIFGVGLYATGWLIALSDLVTEGG